MRIRGGQLGDEVHGYGSPGSIGNWKWFEVTMLLVMDILVAITKVTGRYIVFDELSHVDPIKVSLN